MLKANLSNKSVPKVELDQRARDGGFIVTDDGHWVVVQQGMNGGSRPPS